MRENIILLIEDSIVNTKLINSLDSIGIDASIYVTSSVSIIFNLLNLEPKISKDDFYKLFFELIKNGEEIDFTRSRMLLKKYAEKVLFDMNQQFGLI